MPDAANFVSEKQARCIGPLKKRERLPTIELRCRGYNRGLHALTGLERQNGQGRRASMICAGIFELSLELGAFLVTT